MAKETNQPSLSEVYSEQARRRRRAAIFIFLLAAYAVLLGGAWLTVRSPMFRIQRIDVEGNKNVLDEDIITFMRAEMSANSFWKRMLGFGNMLAWPAAVSGKTLAFFPDVKSISVEKNYRARTLTIHVRERHPFGIWCLMGPRINADNEIRADVRGYKISENPRLDQRESTPCWWFDREGVLFKSSFIAEGSLISVVHDYSGRALGPGSAVVPKQFVQNLFSALRAISDSGISVKEIRLNDLGLQEIEVDTYDGPKIYFSLRFPSESAAAVIKSLMSQGKFSNLEYLDFRVENRAYYK